MNAAYKIRTLDFDCEHSYTAGSERHAVFVLLVGVQHAQGHRQVPFKVGYDGKGQRGDRLLTVVRQDVLVGPETQGP